MHTINKAATPRSSAPRTISRVRKGDDTVRSATGRTWDQWFRMLDKWGAKEKKHREIARWLVDQHNVDGWWSQSITVAYEQERGLRAPGQRSDGTFSVGASKTVNAPVAELYAAFADETVRARWLGRSKLEIRSVQAKKSIRADWKNTTTRVTIWFESTGRRKGRVSLAHEKISDPGQADELKVFWRRRLDRLKSFVEDGVALSK